MISYTISVKLMNQLRELAQAFARIHHIAEGLEREELNFIHRNVRISNIGASTRIENAVLTDAEVNWIDTTLSKDGKTTAFYDARDFVLDKLSKDKERSIDEVVGCRSMLQIIYEQGKTFLPFHKTTLLGLHKELLRYYRKADYYSGQYKQHPNSVIRRDVSTGEQVPVLVSAEPGLDTEEAMCALLEWYNEALVSHPWTIAVAVEFVFRFLAIHPFQDGNGRIGRGLFNLCLLQSSDESLSFMAPFLPIDRHIERNREEYYFILRRCSSGKFSPDPKAYEYEHFLIFMLKVIETALSDFDFYRERYRLIQELSKSARRVLECFKDQPETRLQTKDIVEATEIPRPTVVAALQTLLSQGFLQRYGKKAGTHYQLVF
ncbi:MAG: Fic family protein [Bdellovibrionales bacterium]|nr:Fic family protein [Bdellovibrionales bacterium]